MILVLGGLTGFVGSNTTEALLDLGFDCVVTRHTRGEVPDFLRPHVEKRVFIEDADATLVGDLRRIGKKHRIDGIVSLIGGLVPSSASPVPRLKAYFDLLAGVFQLAEEWSVPRVVISSSAGVYFGLQGTVNEDTPIPLESMGGISSHCKIVETAANEYSKGRSSAACVRLMGMFGPGQDQDVLPQRLVHAAVAGYPPTLDKTLFSRLEDAFDLMYIKDVARAIALIQTSEKLPHKIYNVCSGKLTTTREIASAVEVAVPGFRVTLPEGRTPLPPLPTVDAGRLGADLGFHPQFDLRSGVRDYVAWLKAGHAM